MSFFNGRGLLGLNDATLDMPARNATITAVNRMNRGASRSAALLVEAQRTLQDSTLHPTIRSQRGAMLAQQAYKERTDAEVAKYRAAYSIVAEEAGNKMASWASVAARTKDLTQHKVAIEKTRYHQKQRDLMLQAADAAEKALQSVPPLPMVGPQVASNADMYKPMESAARPSWGWRPRAYRELTGGFFPEDVRRAAGGLMGTDVRVDQQGQTVSYWDSLRTAFAAGVNTTGQVAAQEGARVAGSDPAGGVGFNMGGNILSNLAAMMGKSEQMSPAVTSPAQEFPWVPVVAVGAAGLALLYIWKKS